MADLTPTAAMAIEARRGLKWAEEGLAGSGLVPRTVADARKMADREALSEDKVRRMPAWFARHEVDMSSDANRDPDNDNFPGPGRVAWALWGGDAGRSWAERKVEELDSEQERGICVTVEVEIEKDYAEPEDGEELDDEEIPPLSGEEEMPEMEAESLSVERVKVKLEELRVAASGDPEKKNELVITGYAALFDSRSEDLGGFVEEIDRGAFADALKRSDLDVRFLINHDSNLVLARTKSGTLELSEDERGLRIYARVAPYSYAEDLRIAIERGDVDQMSFAFTTEQDSWSKTEDGENLRRVSRVRDLFDVSVVTYPAYPETKTEVLQRAVARGLLATESSPAEVVPADDRESSETEVRTEQSPDKGAELSRLRELIRSRTDSPNL
jgi:HK97 family phage prohead protease